MAVDVIEFSPELVEKIWDDAMAMPPDYFRHDEQPFLAKNPPLERLGADILEGAGWDGGGDLRLRGYLLGHRLLRSAYGQTMLPFRSPQLIAGYRKLITVETERLGRDFTRDYEAHAAILDLVTNKIHTPSAQYGAKLIFALYGGLANPNRPPVRIQPLEATGMKASRLRPVHASRQKFATRGKP